MSDFPDPSSIRPRRLAPGQRSQVWIANAATGQIRLLFETQDILIEAPNWTLDGAALILNGDGRLWRLPVTAPELRAIEIVGVPDLNNDHVLHPDGEHVFVSANDWHIYETLLAGGPARRITGASGIPGLMHFLHGVSPDGSTLAFTGLEPRDGNPWARANIFTVDVDGHTYTRITDTSHPADGSEFSPDGAWLYFNTEQFSGHAQLARVSGDGGAPQRLRHSDTVDWFPHVSPDASRISFIAFPPGTLGHPADLWVDVMVASVDDLSTARSIAHIFGGQGTINVNSWSPDSEHFAFVSYPFGSSS